MQVFILQEQKIREHESQWYTLVVVLWIFTQLLVH